MRGLLKSPLFIALAVVLVSMPLGLTQAVDFVYWNVRYKLFSNEAPQSYAIVSLDGSPGERTEGIAGSTALQARLLREIRSQHPDHIYFDMPAGGGTDPAGDAALSRVIADAAGNVTLVMRARTDARSNIPVLAPPTFRVDPETSVAASIWYTNFYGYVVTSPPSVERDGRYYPVVAGHDAALSALNKPVFPDFSVDPGTVRTVSAATLLAGTAAPRALTGKTVFVTTTDPNLGTAIGYFGRGRVPSVMADIAGSVALAKGPMIIGGGMPYLVLFAILMVFGRRIRRNSGKVLLYGGTLLLLLTLPALLREVGVMSGSAYALVAAIAYGPARLWQKWRRRVQLTSSASGLPNIQALAAEAIPAGYDVVAASVSQYEQMLASLPRDLHGECARQIARRLALAAGDSKVYDNDNGHFVWLEEPRTPEAQVTHLEGLKALFSAPLVIGSNLLDTNVHFGLDRNVENGAMSRIQSALASASDAQSKGKLFEEFGRQRLVEAPWELSLHARIDEGLRNGDIWLALQAQYDLATGRVSGAEALIRWSDPERGAIPPDAFILQAERAGRIEALTYWVLERAIAASKALNREFGRFQISVNLSARIVDHPGLLHKVAEIVSRHAFDCSLITFEVTETFSMANRDEAKRNLSGLRDMGFRLSIDDFGTGQASLAYLAEIPSDEIKLDKRFIQSIVTDERDRLIVSSMIGLAHSLGQEVVAEGVEEGATLDLLRAMKCDIAQGYFIGRPVAFDAFTASLREEPPKRAQHS